MNFAYCDLCGCETDETDSLVVDFCGSIVCGLCCEAHVVWDHESVEGEAFTSIDESSL